MNISPKFLKSLVFIALYMTNISASQAEIICVDVAQGNAVIVGTTNEHVIPCLIDGGCKSYTYKGKSFKEDQTNFIAQHLIRLAKRSRTNGFNIIISHPDEDHYNMVPDIVDICLQKGIAPRRIILGGVKSCYNDDFKKFITKLHNRSSGLKKLSYASDDESTESEETEVTTIEHYNSAKGNTEIVDVENGRLLSYSIVPCLRSTSSDINAGSLIVLITFENIRFAVTGDATWKTMERLFKYCPDLKLDGMYASHHGAESDGSNRKSCFEKLTPKMVIFSSGRNSHYRHPRSAVLHRSATNADTGSYRPLFAGTTGRDEYDDGLLHAIASNGYGLYITRRELYGTMAHGTMTFHLNEGDEELGEPECESELSFPDRKSCVMALLCDLPNNVFSVAILVTIDLADLEIDDEIESDKANIRTIIKSLIHDGGALKFFYLQHNSINRDVTIELLLKLLSARKRIKTLDMRDNDLSSYNRNLLRQRSSDRCEIIV